MWLYFLYNSNAVSGVSFPVNDLIGANSSLGFTSNSNILSNKANASNIKQKTNLKPDVIIVDPPRSGLDDKMIEDIKNLKPNKLIYVSSWLHILHQISLTIY